MEVLKIGIVECILRGKRSMKRKGVKKKRDEELEEFLNSNPDNRDDIPELFSSEELFDRN